MKNVKRNYLKPMTRGTVLAVRVTALLLVVCICL